MSSMSKRKLLKQLRDLGFTYIENNSNLKFRSPGGKMLIVSGTPRCKYAWNHAIRDAEKILKEERLNNGRTT